MNNIQIFENKEFGKVRTIMVDTELWFVGKDVAAALGYSDTNKAIVTHVDEEDKLNDKTASSLGQRGGWIINESGLYSLILSSKLPNAKKFKRWVTSEILPTIRKTGGYIAGQENMTDVELMARALLVAQKQIEERNKQIEGMKPKVLFAQAVETSKQSILVGDLAKLLKQNGVDMGAHRLFRWLRDNEYLIKRGESRNMPTQYSMERGIMEVKESTTAMPDGVIRITLTPKITGKGQTYFVNKFLSEKVS